MNVTKCINGHFFDSDKYQNCPHCGAVANTSESKKISSENKKSHTPFWGRKKYESDNRNVVEMPDKTIGKTFGIFGNEEKKKVETEQIKSVLPTVNEVEENKITTCSNCGKEYEISLNVCPYCTPNHVNNDKAYVEQDSNLEHNSNTAAKGSLHDAVKKAVSGGEGKTVGFFSTGQTESVSANSEPVVGWLVCIKGNHFGESFNIAAGRNSIGRGASNKINISKDNAVSRSKHAWLTYEPKKRDFYIQPGEGSGLTYLNGDNVMESKKLKEKDVLEFGNGQYLLIPLCGETFTWEDYICKE